MIILEADGFFRIIHYPAREEDGAVENFISQINGQADIGSGWFSPGNFIDILRQTDDIDMLIFNPAITDHTAVNAIVDGAGIFNVELVIPAVVISVNQMFADDARQVMFIESAHG